MTGMTCNAPSRIVVAAACVGGRFTPFLMPRPWRGALKPVPYQGVFPDGRLLPSTSANRFDFRFHNLPPARGADFGLRMHAEGGDRFAQAVGLFLQ